MPTQSVVVVVGRYPQFTETWSKNEIEWLAQHFEVHVVGIEPAEMEYRNHREFKTLGEVQDIAAFANEVNADVIHGHVLTYAPRIRDVAELAGKPFTVRSHSFDVLEHLPADSSGLNISARKPVNEDRLEKMKRAVFDDLCLGVLTMPFGLPSFEAAGMPMDKVHDSPPVAAVDAFLDPSPNGVGIMNAGAYLAKKKMDDFIELGSMLPERDLNLYAVGTKRAELDRLNASRGYPVTIHDPVEPEDMPAEYKKNEWLVYTAAWDNRTVGWPVSVVEAQASGVGVCMPALRPDLEELVGSAGFLFESLSDVPDIISGGFPEEKRAEGFELAQRFDLGTNMKTLIDLWP